MSKANLLERRSVVSSLLHGRKDAIVVGGLGASTYDIAAAGQVYNACTPTAVLLSQRLIGAKVFTK